jgi:hypothetical protein
MNGTSDDNAIAAALDRDALPAREGIRVELWSRIEADSAVSDLIPLRGPERRRRRPLVLAASGAVAAAAAVGLIVRSADSPVAPDNTLVRAGVPAPTSTATATTNTADVAPTSAPDLASTTTPPVSTPTSAPTATSANESSTQPPTTPPALTGAPIAVSYLDPPPVYQPQPFATVDFASWGAAVGDDYVVVGTAGDGSVPGDDRLVVVERTGGAITEYALDTLPRALLAGPGRVLYGEQYLPSSEPGVVAIALAGERAGDTIREVPSPGFAADPIGDEFFAHASNGVVNLWQDRALVTPYVDVNGTVVEVADPGWRAVRYDPATDTVQQVGGPNWQLAIEEHPEAANGVATAVGQATNGAAVYQTWIGPSLNDDPDYGEPSVAVIAALMPDGTGGWYSLADGWRVADSNVWGTLLVRVVDDRTELAWFDPTSGGARPLSGG